MSAILPLMVLAALGDPRGVTPCDDFRGIPIGTEVVVEGRYLTDYMHGEGLITGDCMVPIALGPRAEGPLADRFLDATWRRSPYPSDGSDAVMIRMRGAVQMEKYGHMGLPPRSYVRAIELLDVTVPEGGDR